MQIKSPLSELQPRERNEIKSGFTPVRNIGVNLKRLSGQVKGYKKSGYTDLMVDGAPSPHQSDTTLRREFR
ncbi:hypothetical protein DNJ21_21435 [Salmonella enterica subsp. enterica]|nr:hypothetical protein [Salmonella enterica subsp. enterica]HBX5303726.1 hypothetical protein [Klebsiella pneumoniae]HBX5314895.1 hypothetical protein [Klebsiella pneumoniae]